ncbi:MAG: AMP-binding protein [Gemmobacter sp.]|uniref:AMP-binding protein n=1 Tax=Gemmobacter sp. TaxID=1898957 RepID=UPI00391CED07
MAVDPMLRAEQARRRVLRPGRDWAALRTGFAADAAGHAARMGPIWHSCCDSWAAVLPDRVAVQDHGSGRDWTYRQLKDASDRLASALAAAGVGRGDRVAVFLPQGALVVVAHFAILKLSAIVLPLFTLFGAEALSYRLADSGARAAITDTDNLPKLTALRADLPELRAVFAQGGGAGAHDLMAAIAAHPPLGTPAAVGPEDPAVMIYTSGTTGAPKGALHAHRFLLGHLPSMEITHEGFPLPGDCGWTPADWAWIGGLMDMAIPCLYYGVPLVAHRMARFDPAEAWALIRDRGIRNAFLPPTALKLMRQAPVPDGVALRSVSSGGESLGADLLAWGRQALGCPINELYGQTECNLMLTQAAGFMPVKPGTMGKALPGFEVAVLRPDGAVAAADEVGEIAVRRGAPSMFLGYWNQPEKTAAKFQGDWMRTGDLATCDADGYFTYVARDDDIITSSGYRIGPTEIENCLTGDPDVVMAAVVGVPDPIRTEIVVAHVVLREGAVWSDALSARLVERVRSRVSPHVAPRRIVARASLPMTATGKIIRRALRDEGLPD